MGRKRNVNYWPSRGGYGCWFNGRQVILATGPDDSPAGPVFTAALAAYRELLARQNIRVSRDANTVGAIAQAFIEWIARHRSPNTLAIRRKALRRFVERFGRREIASLTRHEISTWLHDQTDQRNVIHSAGAMFGWAIRHDLCSLNPAKGIEYPSPGSRGDIAYLSAEQYAAVLASGLTAGVRGLIVVLHATGARPGEIRLATGRDYRPALRAIVYAADRRDGVNKTGRKTRRDRVIMLDGEALRIVQERVERFGESYLFPPHRKPWDRPRSGATLTNCFTEISRRVGFTVTAYSFRHTYCTDWILSGRPVDVLAELIGSSPQVIRRHYAHLLAAPDHLRKHLDGFR